MTLTSESKLELRSSLNECRRPSNEPQYCLYISLSLTNEPYLFVALVNTRRTAFGSVLGAGVLVLVQLHSVKTTSEFSARVSTYGMWWLILLSPSFLPFLLARTRNYSSLSYFLSSFHLIRLRSSSCSPRVLRRATLRSILA